MGPIYFDDKEFRYLADTDFLTAKHGILKKVTSLFMESEQLLKEFVQSNTQLFNRHWLHKSGKISKGENYRLLPYVVLDFPRHFTKDEVFSFRTMFWWGHFFSCTLHLQGAWLNKEKAISNLLGQDDGIYLCMNRSPWEYHYGPDNYRLLKDLGDDGIIEAIHGLPFLKISRKIPLSEWRLLPSFCEATFERFLEITTEI